MIWNIIKKKEKTGTVVNRKQSGQEQITPSEATEEKRIATAIKRKRILTSLEITNSMNSSLEDLKSVTTVKRL